MINSVTRRSLCTSHDDVIKWKHFPRYWPFVWGIHRSSVNSPHKGQWRGALMFPLICVWKNGWANSRDTGDLRRHRAHYNVSVRDPLSNSFEWHLGYFCRFKKWPVFHLWNYNVEWNTMFHSVKLCRVISSGSNYQRTSHPYHPSYSLFFIPQLLFWIIKAHI